MSSKVIEERYLVIGGSGFLGSYIVEALVGRGEKEVAVYDLTLPPKADVVPTVTYFTGDILDEKHLVEVLQKTSTTTVFHTVSPVHGLKRELYFRVNVDGTRSILSACNTVGIKTFVFTSSTGAIWAGQVYSGVTEEEVQMTTASFDAYGYTKGLAEKMVLEANGVDGMRTAAIRPCGMVGPRDRQVMWRMAEVYEQGQHVYQIGDNTNEVNLCYAGNVADAHILAGDKLSPNNTDTSSRDAVAGQAFFATDGEHCRYWTFPRMVWKLMGDDENHSIVTLPRALCFVIAFFAGLWSSLTGQRTNFTFYAIRTTTTEQWYSIEKARKLLGYKPSVSLEEGCRKMVEWWDERGQKEHAQMIESRKSK